MKRKIFSIIAFLIFYSSSGIASDLIEVLPLTNKIVMLRFNDGYATYHKIGQLYILIKKYPTFQSKSIPPTNKNG